MAREGAPNRDHTASFTRERKRLLSHTTDGNESDSESIHSQNQHHPHQHPMRVKSHDDYGNKKLPPSSSHSAARWWSSMSSWFTVMNSTKMLVLLVLSLQNSLFTVLRRYSQGVLKEDYSKYEVLLVGEIIKLLFSAYMIREGMLAKTIVTAEDGPDQATTTTTTTATSSLTERLRYLVLASGKMVGLALIYGAMNILSFVSLRNIGAGMFTIFAQCKILTTASFSAVILHRQYSWTKWRALLALMFGVLLFSEPIWGNSENLLSKNQDAVVFVGVAAVLIEVTLSGFASIYFEKVIKTDPLSLTIWERNFQLALGSVPVYLAFIAWSGGGPAGLFGGWSVTAWVVSLLGAAGGLLVALSIKYGDAILKTLATTAAIILSSVLDWAFLDGPLTPIMVIAAVQVIVAICNYSFDPTPEILSMAAADGAILSKDMTKDSDRPIRRGDEEIAMAERRKSESS